MIYDEIGQRIPAGTELRTPDAKRGQPFTVDSIDAESISVRTARGGRVKMSLFTFETAVKYLADCDVRGDSWLPLKDENFQALLNMENDRVRAGSYVVSILEAAGLVDIDRGRPNRVRLRDEASQG